MENKKVVFVGSEVEILKGLLKKESNFRLDAILSLKRSIEFKKDRGQELDMIPRLEEKIEKHRARQSDVAAMLEKL